LRGKKLKWPRVLKLWIGIVEMAEGFWALKGRNVEMAGVFTVEYPEHAEFGFNKRRLERGKIIWNRWNYGGF
jgi:hypothetical protein